MHGGTIIRHQNIIPTWGTWGILVFRNLAGCRCRVVILLKSRKEAGGFLLSHTLWAEGSKSSGREVGHSTGQSLISISFRPGTSLGEATLVLTILLDYYKF